MRKRASVILVFLMVFSFVSAEITLSEPREVYNLGDQIYITAEGLRGGDTGNLDINLVCSNESTNLVRISARAFSEEEEQSYSIPYKILTRSDLGISSYDKILGSCQIVSRMGERIASTKAFTITKDVNIDASFEKLRYEPGEEMRIKVNVKKANGDMLNGFVESLNSSAFSEVVTDGTAVVSFSVPETTESGTYIVSLHAYDVWKGETLNEGYFDLTYEILQVPSFIILSLSDVQAVPGEDFSISAEIYDQSGKVMQGIVNTKIISPTGGELEIGLENDVKEIEFPINATPGTWKVVSTFEGIVEEREFELVKVQKVNFDFEDTILVVRNVGNSIYNKTIRVKIGEDIRDLNLNMGLGEVRKFNLEAPEGEYDVVVGDDSDVVSKRIMLTGNAISVDDLKGFSVFSNPFVLWTILIIILAGIGIVLIIRYKKTRKLGAKNIGMVRSDLKSSDTKATKSLKDKISDKISKSKDSSSDKSVIDLTNKQAGTAESALVTAGDKYPSAVVCIKIKNLESLSDNSHNSLKDIVDSVHKLKGLVDWREDYVFVVFSPLITKTYDNEVLASKAGFQILQDLKEHNKKFSDKFKFNIGANSGDLVASKANGKLKYTSIGNTISLAKRIADNGEGKFLVSESIRKKMLRDLKVERAGDISGRAVYSVNEVRSKAADQAKLKELLKRMDK